MQRAVQMVHAWVQYWQTHPEGETNDPGVNHVASGSPETPSCDVSYDHAPVDHGRHPNLGVDDSKTDYEDELHLPVEPVCDQFGADLDDETEHTGEFYLPFDT